MPSIGRLISSVFKSKIEKAKIKFSEVQSGFGEERSCFDNIRGIRRIL